MEERSSLKEGWDKNVTDNFTDNNQHLAHILLTETILTCKFICVGSMHKI